MNHPVLYRLREKSKLLIRIKKDNFILKFMLNKPDHQQVENIIIF